MAPTARANPGQRKRVLPVPGTVVVAVLAAGAIAVAAACSSDPTPPNGTPTRTGDVLGGFGSQACLETYRPEVLAQRSIAFDGTVSDTPSPVATSQPGSFVPITFRVNHWYKGGSGSTAVVDMYLPVTVAGSESASFAVGSRMLVAADPPNGGDSPRPTAWACGFTRWYTDADARVWRGVFD
jgi:hypothetical protein